MKRRTRLITIGCAVFGTIPMAATAAFALTNQRHPSRVNQTYKAPLIVSAARTSAPPPHVATPPKRVAAPAKRVAAPLARVTVLSGDSLSAIGARTSRTWEQLAG